jgi:hypothetical protein
MEQRRTCADDTCHLLLDLRAIRRQGVRALLPPNSRIPKLDSRNRLLPFSQENEVSHTNDF